MATLTLNGPVGSVWILWCTLEFSNMSSGAWIWGLQCSSNSLSTYPADLLSSWFDDNAGNKIPKRLSMSVPYTVRATNGTFLSMNIYCNGSSCTPSYASIIATRIA